MIENPDAYRSIIDLLKRSHISYSEIDHQPCKTSDESKEVRVKAGFPNAVGAKALLTKLYFTDTESFATIVLPGNHVLHRESLIEGIPNLKKIRFATAEELFSLAGVVPGCMPPFASQVFPEIPILIIATALIDTNELGFNIVSLEKSIVLKTKEYLSIINPTYRINCSVTK